MDLSLLLLFVFIVLVFVTLSSIIKVVPQGYNWTVWPLHAHADSRLESAHPVYRSYWP